MKAFQICTGIAFCEGPKWEKIRAWTVKTLRDYGFNKTLSMEASISEDVQTLLAEIDENINSSYGGVGIFDVSDLFLIPVFKLPWKLIMGRCTDQDIETFKPLIKKTILMAENTMTGAGLINAFPFIRFLFPKWTGHNITMEFVDESYKLSSVS